MAEQEQFTKYEKARIIGARALQIAMNAPILIKMSDEDLESIKYDALRIAEIELDSGILPISINKPLPKRKEEKLKRIREVKIDDKKIEEEEMKEEEEISKGGEIMALASPEDEDESSENESSDEEK